MPSPRWRCATPADLTDPAEQTLHPGLLPAAGRADRRGRRARVLAIKDMAGLLRPPAGGTLVGPRCENGSTCRCTCTPTTPPAVSSATLLAAVGRRGGRRRRGHARRCRPPPASPRPRRWWRPWRTPSGPPDWTCVAVMDLEPYWEAVRKVYAAVRVGAGRAPPAGFTTTRSPAGSCPTCGSRPSRWAWGEVRADRGDVRRGRTTHLGRPVKVTPSSKVVGDLALHLVAVDADPAEFEADPQSFDIPDSVIGFLARRAGRRRRAAGPSRCAARRWRGAASPGAGGVAELTAEDREGIGRGRAGRRSRR